MNTTKDIHSSVKLVYFPLNIAVIEDDNKTLSTIQQELKDKLSNIKIYHSAIAAIDEIVPIKVSIKDLLDNFFCDQLNVNYNMIREFVYQSREKQGIIISDYNMPDINGIELLEKYSEHNVLKVLLTGIYTPNEAVHSLQDQVINHYIPKEDLYNLSNTISILQHKYFNALTHDILNLVNINDYKFLFADDYTEIFNRICQEFKINQYYILNSFGNYHLSNSTHKYILTIYSMSDLNNLATEIPQNFANEITSGKLIPSYFLDNRDHMCLIPATRFGNYCYAVEDYQD